jgi:galactose-1-phosphate uridylyltransferase
MSLISKSKDTKSIISELNKEWRNYTKRVDSLIEGEVTKPQNSVTFIIRRRKGCDVSLSDIFEAELKKLEHLLDNM